MLHKENFGLHPVSYKNSDTVLKQAELYQSTDKETDNETALAYPFQAYSVVLDSIQQSYSISVALQLYNDKLTNYF